MHCMNAIRLMALCLLFWSSIASADAVMAEVDMECPSGSMAEMSHGGGYCHPLFRTECASDADCAGETKCLELSRCIQTSTRPAMDGSSYLHVQMVFPRKDGSCTRGECTTKKVCVEAASVATDACVPTADPTVGEIEAAAGRTGEKTGPVNAAPQDAASASQPSTDSSSCATVVAGLSASMAGLIGLVALARRES
jgi:hypothetical protein